MVALHPSQNILCRTSPLSLGRAILHNWSYNVFVRSSLRSSFGNYNFTDHLRSAPPEAPHPLEEEFPGSWPAEPTEQSQAELQQAEPLTEPRTTFNLRDEIKKNRGGSRRHRGRGRYQPRNPNYRLSRDELRELAESTLEKIDEGQYNPPHSEEPYDLATKVNFTNDNTAYYAPDDADIENWVNADLGVPTESTSENPTKIVIREYSTLVGTRRLHNLVHSRTDFQNKVVGVLNFASAKKPGGGFLNGSQAQV